MSINLNNIVNAFDNATGTAVSNIQTELVNGSTSLQNVIDTELVQPMTTELTNFVNPIITSTTNLSDEIYHYDSVNGHQGILADVYNKTEDIIVDLANATGDIPIVISDFTKSTNDSINSVSKTLTICFIMIGVSFFINSYFMRSLASSIKKKT